ncbi:MAG TPA: hypothetical protein PLV45_15475, partial [bacterium]|nr:hypothetical protein [bacterium]
MTVAYTRFPPTPVVTRRCTVQNRAEIHRMLAEIASGLPDGSIAGPPFCIFHFITSVTPGHDVTLGVPVR